MKTKITIASIFFLGIIVGAASVNLIFSKRMDLLFLENAELHIKLEEQQNRLNKLEESLREHRKRVVKNIVIIPDTQNDLLKIKIRETAGNLLKDLIGTDLAKLDPMLVYNILNNRKITVNGIDIILDVELLVMDVQIEVFLNVKEVEQEVKE